MDQATTSLTLRASGTQPISMTKTALYDPGTKHALLANTASQEIRDLWANKMISDGVFDKVTTFTEVAPGICFSDLKTETKAVKFMCPSFIRDVKYNFSERTGKTTTVVFFEDGTKELSTPSGEEEFDPVIGIEQCILKRIFGNRSQLKKVFKQWVPGYKAREKAERQDESEVHKRRCL